LVHVEIEDASGRALMSRADDRPLLLGRVARSPGLST